MRARGDSGGEQRSRRTVDRAIAAAGNLVQGAERQPALRQMPVNRLDPERQHRPWTRGSAFEALNALAKCRKNRNRSGRAHVLLQLIEETMCSLFVPSVLSSQFDSVTRRNER